MKRLGALSQSRTVENINDPNMKARGNETNDWRSLEKEIIELAVTGNKLSEIKKQLKLIYDLLYEEGITVKGERFVLINNSIQRLCKLMDEVTGLPLRRAFRIIRRNLDEALR